ncbi:uncharacterized protein LOC126933873 [Macaca thibetana thibetana]|uniref:Macaca fascicularis brain cDNA clone: QccE-17840, similar to human tigger transposable element derived 1 (TIGD1), mRNA, RefSeq: NM_145702.1 n=1 Tax=Macaca fascicularis TaxID=9541 RepID=I7GAC7_MACFA|nr:uncharacterized protein LOC123568443 [Macaca fascicularis]XP_050610036.1 uncharacterized protein LOC126933873 [Macaca thibetana thibetana]BAE88523.1 unnamed protein product [Macaca fascicularis]
MVNEHWLQLKSQQLHLAPNERVSLSIKALKPSFDFSFAMKVLDGLYSSNIRHFTDTEYLLFSVLTCSPFITDLRQIFGRTCCSTLHSYAVEMPSFLQPQEPTSASSQLFFCSFLTPLSLHGIKRVGVLLWIRLWLKRMLCMFGSSVQTTETFSIISSKAVWLSYHLCVQWSSTFNFLQELSLCIHNLANWCARPRFWSTSAFG